LFIVTDHSYLTRILTARVYDVAIESPLERARAISARTGFEVLLKREDLQSVFSFKLRGAYNKMAHLQPAELARGVICASAGNHAQGVALAAQKLGCKATIVMPVTTPQIKIDAVAARGAAVELAGESFQEAYAASLKIARQRKLTFVHPYDDPLVIAGQGTIGMEILRQHQRPIHAIFVPVGGGGLIAGIAAYVKAVSPSTRIIGVQPVDSDAMTQSLALGERVTLPHVNIFADGVAVKQVGEETFRLAQQYVDEMITVDTDEICAAIKDIFEDTRSIMEPAGGLAVAAIKRYAATHKARGKTLVAICCGANMNFDRLRFVAERAELGEAREAVLAVTLPERPGAFRTLCMALGARSITEFNYRYAPGPDAHVFIGVQMRNRSERPALLKQLKAAGLPAVDLTDNELAKLHARHLVGGRAPHDLEERIFRFEFPERPGALMNFLSGMHSEWNITLFHYRNHGADYGRVLVGMQIPPRAEGGRDAFEAFAKALNYPYVEETSNPAYRLFLK
jgi:threonine dehydratase